MKRKMADKEGARFCSTCGEKLIGNDRYCIKCANKRKLDNQEIATESVKKSRTKSLGQFIQEKGKERHGFFKPKFRFNSRTSSNTPPNLRSEVIINVGLIESNDKGIVEKIFTAEDVQKAAIKKHSEIDQYFCHLDEYILCFPDQKVIEYIPGASEVFTVEKYK